MCDDNTPRWIELPRPDDLHLHLRDGEMLRAVVGATARQFGRALIMPNLKPPVTTTDGARAYRDRILAALPHGGDFEPLMTLYLTDETGPDEIRRAVRSGVVWAAKLYPAGATTHSAGGVTDMERVFPALEAMQTHDLVLSVHGEVTDAEVDIFDREAVFLERELGPLITRFPGLRVVVEHVTTADGVAFVRGQGARVAGTITPQHLLFNRNALLVGGLRPHLYCLPVLKRERHRLALVDAATSGEPCFFAGTDSAPHARGAKEHACGCAGCFSAPVALELYAAAFDRAGALDRLPDFVSRFGAAFYGLPQATGSVRLGRRDWKAPTAVSVPGGDPVVVLSAGETLRWKLLAEGRDGE